jgi:SSS family solute:Na+ symporter
MSLLNNYDWWVVGGYFLIVFAVAVWAMNRNRSADTSSDYFLAGRNVGWFVVGASLFASNIGSEHLIGLAGAGASSGLVMGQFELQASFILLILGWIFVPFYFRSGVFTMPEFLERRFSPATRWYLALISIVAYVLTKISVTIYAGGVVFESLMGVSFWTGALIIVAITGAYTVFGGLRAVVYTDMVQAFVLIAGAVAVTVAGLVQLGGWDAMAEIAGPERLDLWKPASDPDFPWTGIVFGAPIGAIWYWCSDQFIVQRTLSARGIVQARQGTIFAAYLKQLPLFIFVLPGVIAFCLAQRGELSLDAPDQALPTLVATLLPAGARGLVVAGLLAALMSSLSSVFNSCSTLITLDIYKKLRPDVSEHRLVLIGRLSTVLLVILGFAWIPLMSNISGVLYFYLQSVSAYIAAPIAIVFVLGIAWKRANATGAIVTLVLGFVIGILRIIAELNKENLDGALYAFADVNFLHFEIFIAVVSAATLVLVSLASSPQPEEQLAGLTFATTARGTRDLEEDGTAVRWFHVVLSVVILMIVALVMVSFSA